MNIVEPITITPDTLISSNVPEDDAPAWSGATTYNEGERVIYNHRVWECQHNGTHQGPPPDEPAYWLDLGATNRLRAFDHKLNQQTINADLIMYSLLMPITTDTIGMIGLNASEAQVVVNDPSSGIIYDETVSLISSVDVIDAWTYFFGPFTYLQEYIFRGVPAWSAATVDIFIRGGPETEVAEIIIGVSHQVGETLVGTGIGIRDYSIKTRDEWGNAIIHERDASDVVTYQFSFPTTDARRLRDLMKRIRATPALYDAGPDTDEYGTTIAGFYRDFNIPLTTNVSFGVLEVESLI